MKVLIRLMVRDDEDEQVRMMIALQKPEAHLSFKSPHTVVELIAINAD